MLLCKRIAKRRSQINRIELTHTDLKWVPKCVNTKTKMYNFLWNIHNNQGRQTASNIGGARLLWKMKFCKILKFLLYKVLNFGGARAPGAPPGLAPLHIIYCIIVTFLAHYVCVWGSKRQCGEFRVLTKKSSSGR